MRDQIILASASPRRQELLSQVGLTFTVRPSHKEEQVTDSRPDRVVEALSYQKAEDIANQIGSEAQEGAAGSTAAPLRANGETAAPMPAQEATTAVVIGADTVVSCDGRILGKPASREEAAAMLTLLQGRSHQVYTGVTLFYRTGSGREWETETFSECTEVTFYPMSREEIRAYVETGEPMDKAGAYGIQGKCAAYIKKICGDYNNVVGLPVGHLCQLLREKGLLK